MRIHKTVTRKLWLVTAMEIRRIFAVWHLLQEAQVVAAAAKTVTPANLCLDGKMAYGNLRIVTRKLSWFLQWGSSNVCCLASTSSPKKMTAAQVAQAWVSGSTNSLSICNIAVAVRLPSLEATQLFEEFKIPAIVVSGKSTGVGILM